jgi:predicted Zn finger-like uncharacterized protein
MIIECPQCKAKYSLDEKRFAGAGKASGRCKSCNAQFSVDLPHAEAGTHPAAHSGSQAKTADAEGTRLSKSGPGLRLPEGKVVALSVTEGPLKGQVYRLKAARAVLGRTGADIVVADPEVSRRHCAIEVSGPRALLVDLGTTNGTFVDGKKIKSHELQHLSEFRIGASTLLFTVTDKDSPPA